MYTCILYNAVRFEQLHAGNAQHICFPARGKIWQYNNSEYTEIDSFFNTYIIYSHAQLNTWLQVHCHSLCTMYSSIKLINNYSFEYKIKLQLHGVYYRRKNTTHLE